MTNIYDFIRMNASHFDQLEFGADGDIFIDYLCPIPESKSRVWTHKNCLLYVMGGTKGYSSMKQYHESKQGQVLFIRKGGYVLFQRFEAPYRALIFMFGDRSVKALMEEYPVLLRTRIQAESTFMDQPELLVLETSSLVETIFTSSLAYLKRPAPGSAVSLELKFKELLVNLLGEKESNVLRVYLSWLCSDRRAAFTKLMLENSYMNFTAEELARTACMSLSTFKRMFQKHLGMPPGKWLRRKRIERAQNLLKNSTKTVSDIAFELGYSDAASFSKAFKEITGLTPGDFASRALK